MDGAMGEGKILLRTLFKVLLIRATAMPELQVGYFADPTICMPTTVSVGFVHEYLIQPPWKMPIFVNTLKEVDSCVLYMNKFGRGGSLAALSL